MFKYQEILEELGIDKQPRDDGEIHISCPLHDDSSPSFDINAETGLWVCRSMNSGCGQGNIVKLVVGILGITYKEAFEWLEQRLGGAGVLTYDEIYQELEKIRNLMSRELEVEKEEIYPLDVVNLIKNKWPVWWPERGFDVDDWMGWDVYFDPQDGDAVIPVYDMIGICRGIIRRKPAGRYPKYWYPREFHKSKYLFGEDHCFGKDHIYIVEGPLDCIWMNHMGFPSVAIMGSSISDDQYWRLSKMGVREVTMALDGDKAGINGMLAAFKSGKASGFNFVLLPSGKDPNDIKDKQELQRLLDNKISIIQLLTLTQE